MGWPVPSSQLLEAVAVTAELCGRVFSEAAARVFVSDLAGFPEAAVMRSLARCRKEVRGALTLADVISRLDDGRPGPEEAWAMLPRGEGATVVWTEEMAQAWGIVAPMLNAGEDVAARMAFKEAYVKAVGEARDQQIPVKWTVSLGHDPGGREPALMQAVQKGRLSADHAAKLLPSIEQPTPGGLMYVTDQVERRDMLEASGIEPKEPAADVETAEPVEA